ncbi:unnamed protein product [Caenorhabditis brenneri]
MSSSTLLPPYTYVYQSIKGIKEYIDFKYSPDWVSIYTLFMISYTIPSVIVFVRILVFYFVNSGQIKKTGLRMEIFQSFLLMQFWSILWLIGDFTMFRIPYTSILTSYCASENPQFLMKAVVFFYHFGAYAAQLFTVMFCGMRVAIMYSAGRRKTEKIVQFVPFFIISISFLLSFPHFLSDGMCIQMSVPYPFGSILIISHFHYYNLELMVLLNLSYTASVTTCIVVLNYFMMQKIKERKMLFSSQTSSQSNRIEKTLTTTMIILMIPSMLILLVGIGELFHFEVLSYILSIRPLFLDARVHIVTCYFYLTHPVFKKEKIAMVAQASITHNFSLATLKTVE